MFECKEVRLDPKYLHVELNDGRILSTPLKWYKGLEQASIAERQNFKLIARKTMIEWPTLDIHIDIEEMFRIDGKEAAA